MGTVASARNGKLEGTLFGLPAFFVPELCPPASLGLLVVFFRVLVAALRLESEPDELPDVPRGDAFVLGALTDGTPSLYLGAIRLAWRFFGRLS